MPAPKKDQSHKDQTRRRRDVRKYRKSCRSALGPLGTRAFREFLNLHGRLPIETTACWAEALAWVFGKKGTALSGWKPEKLSRLDLKKYRGQFGGWSQSLLRRRLDLIKTSGLSFTVRLLEVTGDLPKPWRARLFILYERQHGVVFHYLKKISTPDRQDGGLIWKLLNQAVHHLGNCRWRYFDPAQGNPIQASVAFPVRGNGKFVHPLLGQAAAMLHDRNDDSLSWQATTFKGLRSTPLKLGATSFFDFHWELRWRSRRVSAALRALRPRSHPAIGEEKIGIEVPSRPAWLLVFPDEYPYDFQRYS